MESKTLKAGNGNLWKGLRPIPGKLYLTGTALHHVPNFSAFHRTERTVELEDIDNVEISTTMAYGFIPLPNEVRVTLNDGEVLKYIVNGRKKWKKAIDEAAGLTKVVLHDKSV
ncbi:hypothetical protein [Salinicoccus carnicancri]|uniref:hypothetical protein n=1 Tax=Salinicoccus carnicancri TaxID=558170 RepID=UPI0002F581D7|nr:hypothetical protein [Salinicoccus carnicancri]